jgi:hypothetical protein
MSEVSDAFRRIERPNVRTNTSVQPLQRGGDDWRGAAGNYGCELIAPLYRKRGVNDSAISAACGPYCISWGMSESTMAMKTANGMSGLPYPPSRNIGIEQAGEHDADQIHLLSPDAIGDVAEQRNADK